MELAHRHKVESPDSFVELEEQLDALGPGLHAVIGITESGAERVQEIIFGADCFTKQDVLAWLEARGT